MKTYIATFSKESAANYWVPCMVTRIIEAATIKAAMKKARELERVCKYDSMELLNIELKQD